MNAVAMRTVLLVLTNANNTSVVFVGGTLIWNILFLVKSVFES